MRALAHEGFFAAQGTNPEGAMGRGMRADLGVCLRFGVGTPAEFQRRRWCGEKACSSQTRGHEHFAYASHDLVESIVDDTQTHFSNRQQICEHDTRDCKALFPPQEIRARTRPAEN